MSSSLIHRTRAEGGRERTEQETFVYLVNKHPSDAWTAASACGPGGLAEGEGPAPSARPGSRDRPHEGWRAIFLASGTGKGGPWVRPCMPMHTGDPRSQSGSPSVHGGMPRCVCSPERGCRQTPAAKGAGKLCPQMATHLEESTIFYLSIQMKHITAKHQTHIHPKMPNDNSRFPAFSRNLD